MCSVLSLVSLKKIGILRFVKRVLWTPMCCIVATMYLFSKSLNIVARCGGLLLNVIFSYSSARCIPWLCFALIRLSCHCVIRHVAAMCMLYKVNCLFSEFASASVRVLHNRAAAAAHPLEFDALRC